MSLATPIFMATPIKLANKNVSSTRALFTEIINITPCKYAAAKGHGVRIGGGGKVDKMINEVMKRRYLCHHAGKASSKQTTRSNVTSCRVECPWKVNIWVKEKKGYLEVTTFNDHHVGYECHPSASKFVPTL
ncbi:hypothetical protein RhiirA5_434807 [Rhizophagus irregularis]|uniref:FAR1 domain-containing protein n=1 Tax=Rhizophagus irregularis TaxID=588596 RepID=A0A2N0NPF2_9GLOM|nr:hypothetical protein RhiirA5_434807 [Rhizophagus irregularis]